MTDDDKDSAKKEAARHAIAECNRKLNQYRAALDSGANPATVAKWMADVEVEKARAEAVLTDDSSGELSLTRDQVQALVEQLVDIVAVLEKTDRGTKAKIYAELGVRLTYKPDARKVLVETLPRVYSACVGEAIASISPRNQRSKSVADIVWRVELAAA